MNTYRVVIGGPTSVVSDICIVRAKNCAEAERKAIAEVRDDYDHEPQVTKIELLEGRFVK